MQVQNSHMAASSSPIYGGGPRRGKASTNQGWGTASTYQSTFMQPALALQAEEACLFLCHARFPLFGGMRIAH